MPEEEHRHGLREVGYAQGWDRVQGRCSWHVLRRCCHQDALRADQILQALIDRTKLAMPKGVHIPKNFLQYSSHRIFGHMHKVVNVMEKITNYTV